MKNTDKVNSVKLNGYLGKDPLVKMYSSGARRATFLLATTDTYKNSLGKMIDSIQWHRLTAWGRTAEQVENLLRKGTRINAEGRIHYYKTNVGDAGIRTYHEIVLDRFELQVA